MNVSSLPRFVKYPKDSYEFMASVGRMKLLRFRRRSFLESKGKIHFASETDLALSGRVTPSSSVSHRANCLSNGEGGRKK
jgi:hypothetical protein